VQLTGGAGLGRRPHDYDFSGSHGGNYRCARDEPCLEVSPSSGEADPVHIWNMAGAEERPPRPDCAWSLARAGGTGRGR
jgi:hypothetical protein